MQEQRVGRSNGIAEMRASQERSRTSWMAAAIGTAVVAFCCFPPLLVSVLGLMGLSFLTPYLDYVLLPALVVLLVITVVSYRQWRKAQGRL